MPALEEYMGEGTQGSGIGLMTMVHKYWGMSPGKKLLRFMRKETEWLKSLSQAER